MTETPDTPPPAPIEPRVTPVGPPSGSVAPAVPPGTPAGRPRVGQAALLFAAFGIIAGGSCAAFLSDLSPGGAGSSGVWSFLFAVSVPLAAGAFALLVFRLWRRRFAEAWPSVGQALLMGVAGTGLAIGGCGGFAASTNAVEVWPVAMVLGAAFVAGMALAVGAGELFFIALARLIVSPRK